MATLTERIAIILDATDIGAIKGLRNVGNTAKSEMAKVDKATEGTRQSSGLLSKGLDKLGLSSIDVGTALKAGAAAGATVAAAALVKFGKDSISAFSSATAEVSAFKRVSGATAEDASRLVAAMKTLNVDTSAGARAFGLLSKSIENTPSKLAAVGVQIAHNKDGTANLMETLLNVSDAYNKTGDAAQKNNIAMTAFGKSGLALEPILARGRAGLKELYAEAAKHHEIFSDADLQKGKDFRLATAELSQAMHGLEIEAGSKLVPVLTQVALKLTQLTEDADKAANKVGELASHHEKAVGWAKLYGEIISLNVSALSNNGKKTDDSAAATKKLADAAAQAKGAEEGLTTATGEQIKTADDLAKAEDRVAQALLGVSSAGLDEVDANLNVSDSIRDVTDKQNAYNQALKDHGIHSAEFQQAASDLNHSINNEDRALLNAADSAAKFAEQQAIAAGHTFTTVDRANAEIVALQQLEAQFPKLKPVIDDYINELLKIPGTVETDLTLKSQGSSYQISGSKQHTVHQFALGGPVPGAQGAPLPATVHGGEYVVPVGGALVMSAGKNTAGPTYQIGPIYASGADEGRAAGQAIVEELVRWQRSNGPLPF